MPTGREISKSTRKQHQNDRKDVRKQDRYQIVDPDNPDTAETETFRQVHQDRSTGHRLPHSITAEGSILAGNETLTYYPAYCHKSSPTWFEWVKLTACDIHTKLHIKDGYQHSWLTEYRYARDAPQLMFYLNHPIQFVQVVGVVVAFDEYFDRFWLFTIDDSTGMTVDVVCRKPAREKSEFPKADIAANHKDKTADEEEKEILQLSNLIANTVEIGSILQVKGVITLFRRNRAPSGFTDLKNRTSLNQLPEVAPTRQISLQRLMKIHDTNQELNLIAARTAFYNSVLSQPWILSHKEQHKLRKEALGEAEHDKKRAKKSALKQQRLVEIEKEDAEMIQTEYAKEEEQRKQAAEVMRRAGQELKERLERERERVAEKSAPKPAQSLAVVGMGPDSGSVKDRRNKKSHKRRKDDKSTVQESVQPDSANESFAALDDEKSALLKLAFG